MRYIIPTSQVQYSHSDLDQGFLFLLVQFLCNGYRRDNTLQGYFNPQIGHMIKKILRKLEVSHRFHPCIYQQKRHLFISCDLEDFDQPFYSELLSCNYRSCSPILRKVDSVSTKLLFKFYVYASIDSIDVNNLIVTCKFQHIQCAYDCLYFLLKLEICPTNVETKLATNSVFLHIPIVQEIQEILGLNIHALESKPYCVVEEDDKRVLIRL